MLQQIDHIVIVVRDLVRASEDYAQAGFQVTPGGEHVGGATHNALIAFADGTYFELIAFREPDRPQEHRWWPRLAKGEGLVDYALLSDDLAADAARIRSDGLEVVGPVDGGRVRPDGRPIAWRSIFLGRGINGGALPFVIQDVTPRDLRVPGDAITHRLGVTGVAGLTVAVADLEANAINLGYVLGATGVHADREEGAALRFPLRSQWIELLRPADPSSPAGQYVQRFGDSPWEVVLRRGQAAGPTAGEPIGGNLHGARIRVASQGL